MGHPDKGLVQAFLDREIEGAELASLEAHLESCSECKAGAEALGEDSRRVAIALQSLDTAGPRLEEARDRIMAKRKASSPIRSFSLPKAASIALLLSAAAATALPGSPVRRWLAQGWETITRSTPVEVDVADPGPLVPTPEAPETGAGISTSPEGAEIWIHDMPTEAELRIVWVEGNEAWVFAGEGTRFTTVDGRLEAFGPPGEVRVEIPRELRQVVVGLNGSILLRKSGGEVEILAPIQERTPSEIVFDAPGSANAGGS